MKKRICLLLAALLLGGAGCVYSQQRMEMPVETVKRIGDKLIRETPFAYKLGLMSQSHLFNQLTSVNFGRTFELGKEAVAYAYTQLSYPRDTVINVEIDHNDACKIWCNGQLVYGCEGKKDVRISRAERSMELPFSFQLPLKKGNNDLLVKSATYGKEWCVFLQPPSDKDAVLSTARSFPKMGLMHLKNVDKRVADITDWLVIGPFKGDVNTVHAPEHEFEFGNMYQGLTGNVTWGIPKIEVLGEMIDPEPWGTTYQWNYHNGGVAWAMQQLGELTGEDKYTKWATDFCDFQMEGIPFIDYQVNTLHAYKSANALLINSTLLDFTLAPSLPLLYRLRKEKDFKNREIYQAYIDKMMDYARFGQIRSEGMSNYTRDTPEKYTVWVDDMFMGIPFLIQAGLYSESPELKQAFFDDAANQILDFTKHVWDKEARLYMHANYTSRPDVKLPHWARANGWAIWAMTDVLMALPEDHPKYKAILRQYKTFVNSLIRYQDGKGFWHNVIERLDSPEEVSGTAIFVMTLARGVRYGWLDRKKFTPIVKKGWDAVASEIEDDGTVHKICVGTMCTEDVNYYMDRPFYDNDTHGVFAVIFAGMEVQKMMEQFE